MTDVYRRTVLAFEVFRENIWPDEPITNGLTDDVAWLRAKYKEIRLLIPIHEAARIVQAGLIANVVAHAVQVEREACAHLAESFVPSGFTSENKLGNAYGVARNDRARTIAAAIRGRGAEPQ